MQLMLLHMELHYQASYMCRAAQAYCKPQMHGLTGTLFKEWLGCSMASICSKLVPKGKNVLLHE